MPNLLTDLSGLSTSIIVICCVLHVVAFILLWLWWRRDLRLIASTLDDFSRGLKHRSILDATSHLSDQIEAFLADVNEALDNPSRQDDRKLLLDRINILDEKRRYLSSLSFETCYHMARTMIEAYPLAGVLGTILAIGAALNSGPGAGDVNAIVGRFGDAIWSTFAGLSAAILLMFLNSWMETSFARLAENRLHVREMISHAKRELSLGTGEG